MENITDALKMASAILIFVGALSMTIMSFSKARIASASIMSQSGITNNYYDDVNFGTQRVVGVETVLTNLYLYNKTGNTILFYKGNYNTEDKVVSNIEKVPLYVTESSDNGRQNGITSNLQRTKISVNTNSGTTVSREIYGIDINDEIARGELWLHDVNSNKKFIDSLVKRELTEPYTFSKLQIFGSENVYDYANKKIKIGFIYNFDGSKTPLVDLKGKFIERIGEYNYESKISNPSTSSTSYLTESNSTISSNSTSSIIEFSNDGTIENENGQRKKVIQYIYVGNI